jgi:hypothetical protein
MMIRERKMHFAGALLAGLAFAFLMSFSMPSFAGSATADDDCIPGLPCVTFLTPNLPLVPDDGPNADDAPNQAKSTSGSCDADFMNQIYTKAYFEAERENLVNEMLIRKPDSVLEYTCFGQQVNFTAVKAGRIFTESDDWHDTEVTIDHDLRDQHVDTVPFDVYMGSDTFLDNTLQALVVDSLYNYVDTNFPYNYLGGTPLFPLNDDIDQTLSGNDGIYICLMMNAVYFFAKCDNFAERAPLLGFPEIAAADVSNLDFRLFPERCQTPAALDDLIERERLLPILNNDQIPGLPKDFAFSSFDRQNNNYLNMLSSQNCMPPIRTGVQVTHVTKARDLMGNVRTTGTVTYEERVCRNPSCFYHQPSNSCRHTP